MADPAALNPEPKRYRPPHKLLWVLGILAGVAFILFVASFFIDEPLRRTTEQKINSHLKGYSVRLPGLHLQLIGLSLTLKGLTISQDAHPMPPVAYFPSLKASIHWREILSGRLVAEFKLDRPRLHINLQQLQTEVQSKVPMKQRGWQQAVEDIYPLKINKLIINNAELTYIDQDPKRPLELSHLNFTATNIRNIHVPDKVYPSPFQLDTAIFGTGHGKIDGKGNFLAVPSPAMKADFSVQNLPVDYFRSMVSRANLAVDGGKLRTSGSFEIGQKVKKAHVKDLSITGMKVDYIHSATTAGAEKRRAEKAKKAAKTVSNKPGLDLRIDTLTLSKCTFGIENRESSPAYRVFLSDTDLHLSNLSNHFSQGAAHARVTGMFMGNGATNATATFRPETNGADLDLHLKIADTQLTSMNSLLRAYGNFSVTAGLFSLVTELHVKNNMVNGYIKPFFKELRVRKEPKKGPLHRVYEVLIEGVAKLLENRPRKEVATKADISGPLASPKTSTVQILVELLRNAFFKAILPRFEKDVSLADKR